MINVIRYDLRHIGKVVKDSIVQLLEQYHIPLVRKGDLFEAELPSDPVLKKKLISIAEICGNPVDIHENVATLGSTVGMGNVTPATSTTKGSGDLFTKSTVKGTKEDDEDNEDED